MTIVGTRPEIIRLAAVMKLLDQYVDHKMIHTGQNYDYELNQVFFDDLGLRKPDFYLGVDSGGLHFTSSMGEMYELFGPFATVERFSGYYFDDGTFQCDCNWPYLSGGFEKDVGFQIRRSVKGTLDLVPLNIRDVDAFTQWDHQTPSGVTVLLALAPHKALILADLEQSFVVVNVMGGTDIGFGAQQLEDLADSFDFSIL